MLAYNIYWLAEHGHADVLTEINTNNQFCAGNEKRGVCVGDRGGPLVCEIDYEYKGEKKTKAVLYGITTYDQTCGEKYLGGGQVMPGVFVKTSRYIEWIISKMVSWSKALNYFVFP